MNHFFCKFVIIIVNNSRREDTIFFMRFTNRQIFIMRVIFNIFVLVLNFIFHIREMNNEKQRFGWCVNRSLNIIL